MRDQMEVLHPVNVISPAAAGTDNTAIVGNTVNGIGYDSLTYVIVTGGLTDTDATFAVTLDESDNSDMSSSQAATLFTGTGLAGASFTFATDNSVRKLGYLGSKPYTRMTITPTGNNSGNIFVAAAAILGNPHNAPQTNP